MGEHKIMACTLGMYITDDIEYAGSGGRQESVIGGAGTYAAIGARLVAGKEYAGSVGWVVDVGSDFPIDFRTMIETWRTGCLFREDKGRLTTRAWNGYGPGDHRAFKYLTPKLRLDHNSLSDQLLYSQAFHLVCSPERCMTLVHGILGRRTANGRDKSRTVPCPLFIWEPVPDLCTPENVDDFRQAIKEVNIVSPNSEELGGFFVGQSISQAQMVAKINDWGIGPRSKGVLVVRQGKNGCSAFSREHQVHLAAYHAPDEKSQCMVADPTGGGNAFLGALAMAMSGHVCPQTTAARRLLAMDNNLAVDPFFDLTISLIYATVAASFVIEQPGMPTYRNQGNWNETWNGESFGSRLETYLSREKEYLAKEMKQCHDKNNCTL